MRGVGSEALTPPPETGLDQRPFMSQMQGAALGSQEPGAAGLPPLTHVREPPARPGGRGKELSWGQTRPPRALEGSAGGLGGLVSVEDPFFFPQLPPKCGGKPHTLGGTEVRRGPGEVGGSGPEERQGLWPLVRHSQIKDLQRVTPRTGPAALLHRPLRTH